MSGKDRTGKKDMNSDTAAGYTVYNDYIYVYIRTDDIGKEGISFTTGTVYAAGKMFRIIFPLFDGIEKTPMKSMLSKHWNSFLHYLHDFF